MSECADRMAASKVRNLSGLVDVATSNILNAEGRPSVHSLLSGACGQVVRSDADEQLLVNIMFKTSVKLKAISITAPEGEERPSVVKLFINQVRCYCDAPCT